MSPTVDTVDKITYAIINPCAPKGSRLLHDVITALTDEPISAVVYSHANSALCEYL